MSCRIMSLEAVLLNKTKNAMINIIITIIAINALFILAVYNVQYNLATYIFLL